MAVVEQQIEDCLGHNGIVEDRALFSDGPFGGHEDGAELLAAADEREQQMRGVGLERQIAAPPMIRSFDRAYWVSLLAL